MKDKPWLTGLAILLACWPVWPWYAGRIGDRSDEPWGLLAMVVLAIFAVLQARQENHQPKGADASWIWLLLYGLSYPFAPPLLRAAFAALSLAAWLQGWRRRAGAVGIYGLALLSLPLLASLQFYLGYPLRLPVAAGTAVLLRLNGVPVAREGLALSWQGQSVLVDAACSGVKMLWVAALVTCCLIVWRELVWHRALLLSLAAFGLVLLANLLRALTLFYFEAGLMPAMAGFHSLTGLLVFALLIYALLQVSQRLEQPAHVA